MAFPEDAPTKALRGFFAPLEPSLICTLIKRETSGLKAYLRRRRYGMQAWQSGLWPDSPRRVSYGGFKSSAPRVFYKQL